MLIIRFWPYPKCIFKLLYTTLNLKACKISNASGASVESKKVRGVSKGGSGGGGSPEKRPYDVFSWTKSTCDASLIIIVSHVLLCRIVD